MTRFKIAVSAITLAVTMSSALPAMAWRATEWTLRDVRSATRETANEVGGFREEFRDFAKQMGKDLRASSGESSSYTDKSIDALRRITDASDMNLVKLEKQKIRAEAESGDMDVDPISCFIMDMFTGTGSGSLSSVKGGGSYAAGSVMTELSTLPPGESVKRASQVANELTSWKGRDDATTDFGVLMDSPTINFEDTVDSTNGGDSSARALTQAILRNIIEPLPEQAVTAEELRTPEGAARAARIKGKRAKQSVVLETFGMILNMSEPVVPSAPLKELIKGTPYEKNTDRKIPDGFASELQAIDAMVVSYYAPSEESRKKSVSSNAVLQKILQVNAIQARMQFLSLELQRRQAAMQGAQLAAEVEGSGY